MSQTAAGAVRGDDGEAGAPPIEELVDLLRRLAANPLRAYVVASDVSKAQHASRPR